MTDPTPDLPQPRRLRYPAMLELIILGGLVLVLMIGVWMIRALVTERSERARNAQAEIASSWGQSQTFGGPVLIVPFRQRYDVSGRPEVMSYRARFLPERLRINGTLVPEKRHRGIFQTVLYRGDLTVEGEFARPDFSTWNVRPEDIAWGEAVVTVGITDLRGIGGNPVIKFGERSIAFSGGTADGTLWASGVRAAVPLAAEAAVGERYPFSFKLALKGSEQINFYPLGGETIVQLTSRWPDPSFAGAYLPESRSVTPAGFTARWNVSSMARSYPQRWRDVGDEHTNAIAGITPSAFGVGLFSPVGHYQKTDRSMKYAALFIILTFLTFFLYELLSPVTLHPVQYFLVGGALCLFYLLLLSISEQASFDVAYAIASAATIALISSYGAALLRNRVRVLGLVAMLSLLYGYLYVLLQLEDWALLMGSVGLFLILALVMYATRRVDWGSAHVGRVQEQNA